MIGCNNGGGSGSNTDVVPVAPRVLTGVFSDSPVYALYYETATQSGLTNFAGEFDYQAGETVNFSLGGIQLGNARAANQLSPLDLLNVRSLDEAQLNGLDAQLANVLVFLQSLDRDQDPTNGIDLVNLHEDLSFEQLNFDDDIFLRGTYRRIVNQNSGYYQSTRSALNYYLSSLSLSLTIKVPERESIDSDGDSVVDQIVVNQYTAEGNLVKAELFDAVSDELIDTASFEYDGNGNITSIMHRESIELYEFHPSFGLLSHLRQYKGETTSQHNSEYDFVGNLVATEDTGCVLKSTIVPWLSTSGFGGDPSVRYDCIQLGADATSSVSYEYDLNGNLLQSIAATHYISPIPPFTPITRTDTTTYSYENERLLKISMTNDLDSRTNTEINFTYNLDGEQTACEMVVNDVVQDSSALFFDPLQPNHQYLANHGALVPFMMTCSDAVEYDSSGRITRVTQPDSYKFEFEYQNDNLITITSTGLGGSGTDQSSVSYVYSATGDLVETTTRRNDELLFSHRVLEYKSLIVSKLPYPNTWKYPTYITPIAPKVSAIAPTAS